MKNLRDAVKLPARIVRRANLTNVVYRNSMQTEKLKLSLCKIFV